MYSPLQQMPSAPAALTAQFRSTAGFNQQQTAVIQDTSDHAQKHSPLIQNMNQTLEP